MGKTKTMVSINGGKEVDLDKLSAIIKDPAPSVAIKKAKIKDGLFLDVEYNESSTSGMNKVTKSCTAPIHDDLKTAFAKLDQHLAAICEQFDHMGGLDIENTSCRGFAVGGSGESEGVTLMGTRSLDDGKVVNLVSPFTKYSDEYIEINFLISIVKVCTQEVKLYLFDGKQKPTDQLSMFENEQDAVANQEF